MSANTALPPLVGPHDDVADAPLPRPTVNVVVAFVALVATLAALGWGFTQWSSAKHWRERAEKTEAQFGTLEARTTKAEERAVTAERTNARTRRRLVATQQQLSKNANQLAFTKDLRTLICEALPGLPNGDRARICP